MRDINFPENQVWLVLAGIVVIMENERSSAITNKAPKQNTWCKRSKIQKPKHTPVNYTSRTAYEQVEAEV